jgi:alkanesulfonate monooxygenase SsuD/methylene tetrahydromethanopterin reductase-like flavin-dependent oxidoreductase (luciferase family)
MLFGLNVVAAETDAEAEWLASSLKQAFVALRSGRPGPLPPPVDDMDERLDATARAMLDHVLSEAVVGSLSTVAAGLADFVRRTGADELMIGSSIFDHGARLRSFEIVAEVSTSALGAAAVGAARSTVA